MKNVLVIVGLAIVAFAIFFVIYNVPNSQNEVSQINEAECTQAEGMWKDGNCMCGGYAGFKCPEGYSCVLEQGKSDDLGVCVYGKQK